MMLFALSEITFLGSGMFFVSTSAHAAVQATFYASPTEYAVHGSTYGYLIISISLNSSSVNNKEVNR
jgi:hypothetical protein